jgi:IPT/TIG domain
MRLVQFLMMGTISMGLLLAACSDDDEKEDGGVTDAKSGEGTLDLEPAVDQPIPDMDTDKKPVITAIIPSDGFANGGTLGYIPVVMIGKNFAKGARVYIDGSNTIMLVNVSSQASVNFHMPKNPYGNATSGYKPYKADISIMSNGLISDIVKFMYTASKDMDAKFKGVVVSGTNSSYSGFWSRDIEGKVYVEGVTDATSFDKTKITAYIGFGTTGTDPTKDSGWRWSEATYSKIDTGYAVYAAKVKVPSEKSYDIAYRFSTDMGMNYIYADADETDLKYDSTKAATLTATKAPDLYCQVNADCLTAASFMFTCKLDASDDTKHKCVGCLADKDCVAPMPSNLGPLCDASKERCYCKADGDCTKNPLGKKCTSQHCGCAADSDCPSGLTCNPQAYICM